MAGRKQHGRGGGRGYRGGRGFGPSRGGGGGGRGGGSRSRGRGGYVTLHEIDGDFVVDPVPFHPRDNPCRGAAPPSAWGYKRTGKGRGSGLGYVLDHSDSVDNSDYYYSRYSAPVQGASPGPGLSRWNGCQRWRGWWGIAGVEVRCALARNTSASGLDRTCWWTRAGDT